MSASPYELLLAHIGIGVLSVDGQRRIVESNAAAERMLGAREASLVGKSLLEATLSYDLLNLLTTALQTGQPQQQEIRRSEPKSRVLRVAIVPFRSADSGPSAAKPTGDSCLLLMEDVTELRRLETVRRDFVANVSH